MNSDGQLARAVRILDALAERGDRLRFGELAAVLDDLNPASLSRLLKAMQAAGMLEQAEGGYRAHSRVACWAGALSDEMPLAERLQPALERISAEHGVTSILLECRCGRLAPVARCVHEDAPALMALGGSFPPRLSYFASILLLDPEPTEAWVRRQLADAPAMVDRSLAGGLRIVRHFLRHGHYRDRWLYPGQLRLALPITRAGKTIAILGAAGLAAAIDRDAEAELLEDMVSTGRREGTKQGQ